MIPPSELDPNLDLRRRAAAEADRVRDVAAGLLRVDGIGEVLQEKIRTELVLHLAATSLQEACDNHADLIARTLGAEGRESHKTLTPDGWLVLDYGLVRPSHVYAVAAIIRADSSSASPADVFDAIYLVNEAAFMAGRQGMRAAVTAEHAKKRSEAGAQGGRPRDMVVSDEQLRRAWDEEVSRRGSERGAPDLVAASLGISRKTLLKRLREIGIRQ